MSTITNTPQNAYTSLANSSTSGNSGSSATTLAEALSSLTSPAKTASSPATNSYLLDLSEAAQTYLNKYGTHTNSTAKASGNENFLLTDAQAKQLQSIVEKYADAPYTQETFDQLQDDLEDAGLSPDILAAKDQARNVNPTQFLLDALAGKTSISDLTNGSQQEVLKAKKENYMEKVQSMWESISTTKDEPVVEATNP